MPRPIHSDRVMREATPHPPTTPVATPPTIPYPEGMEPYRFTLADLAFLGSSIDPEMARHFFTVGVGAKDVNWLAGIIGYNPFANPGGVTLDEVREFVRRGGFRTGDDPKGFPFDSRRRMAFAQGLLGLLEAFERDRITPTPAPTTVPGHVERESLLTPVSPELQRLLDFVVQAYTGKPLPPRQLDREPKIESPRGAPPPAANPFEPFFEALKRGDTRGEWKMDSTGTWRWVPEERTVRPPTGEGRMAGPAEKTRQVELAPTEPVHPAALAIYQMAQGIVPEAIQRQTAAQIAERFGATGQATGTGAAGAVTRAITQLGQEAQARGIAMQQSILAAAAQAMQARQEQAQRDLLGLYLQRQGLPPEIASLLKLSVGGGTVEQTKFDPGALPRAIGTGLGDLSKVMLALWMAGR